MALCHLFFTLTVLQYAQAQAVKHLDYLKTYLLGLIPSSPQDAPHKIYINIQGN